MSYGKCLLANSLITSSLRRAIISSRKNHTRQHAPHGQLQESREPNVSVKQEPVEDSGFTHTDGDETIDLTQEDDAGG